MDIYLPIADLPVNVFLVFAMGTAVGFISGMFGIGGGFLMTPLLIFIGVSPAVSVATVAAHITASSFSGALTYWRRRAIDLPLAFVLLIGGLTGTAIGVWLFGVLRALGQLDLFIALAYVVLLCSVGGLMVAESVRATLRAHRDRNKTVPARPPGGHTWVHGLPLKARFKQSRLYVSILPVLAIGGTMGFLGAVMGIGGGFILVPMLIYILHVPTNVVIGTSMVLTLVTMGGATIMHAATNHLVDALLALLLMVGGVIGAQFGAQAGQKMRSEWLRLLLGLLVLAVGLRFAVNLFVTPGEIFSFRVMEGGR
ncbi:membrane protein, putative [Rhodovulum sp. PH10]|uniref:sulfite exporter TauE/SafE family protein n=1 Tax=Rhodovulum sp. PH10 TaxID=1187851 RepID=UPI00027C262F|nr:sulfite exporter TauE/SafE family protein [Rhodovulum sp. PH10]EJW12311.1 membrane protein, putative [Rhodovulum sp. PH10]